MDSSAPSLFEELKRRRVFRVLVGYGVVSFGLLQVVEPIQHALHLPEAALTYAVLALGLGFPVAIVLAWAFDLNQGRIERAAPSGPKAARLGLLLVGIGVLAAAPGLGWYFFLRKPAQSAPAAAATPSLAVLAFADLSPTKDQEYFSDGIAEEILNALARVKGLRVAGRTSSFHFKGKNEDLRSIAETLGVANVLEGSVRKQGNKVRITAQLIQASDGFHLWSNTFDGELTDVFALQESIARAITAELKVVLQGNAPLVPVVTANPEAYALYLQASAVFNRRDGAHFADAIARLGEATRLDPGFARAWSRMAALEVLSPTYRPEETDAAFVAAEQHARRAIALDQRLAEPHAVLAQHLVHGRRWDEARPAFEVALALDPDDETTNFWSAAALIHEGYRRQGVERLDRLLTIDPILPNALMWRGLVAFDWGEVDSAERLFRRASDLGLVYAAMGLSSVDEVRGRKQDAIDHLTPAMLPWLPGFPPGSAEVLAQGVFGDAHAREQGLAILDGYLARKPSLILGVVPWLLVRLGQPVRAFAILGEGPTTNDALAFNVLWSPQGKTARTLPGFAEFARKTGLADLWELRGPPDSCRRAAPREYVCQ